MGSVWFTTNMSHTENPARPQGWWLGLAPILFLTQPTPGVPVFSTTHRRTEGMANACQKIGSVAVAFSSCMGLVRSFKKQSAQQINELKKHLLKTKRHIRFY
jgi:hypothetical protein